VIPLNALLHHPYPFSTAVTESFRGLSSRVHKVKSGNLVDRPNSCDFDNLLARDNLVSPRINDNLITTADRESGKRISGVGNGLSQSG